MERKTSIDQYMIDADLNNLEEGRELNPLAFSRNDYPCPDEVLEFVLSHNSEPAKRIDLKELSLNGKVIKDGMEEYLSKKRISSGCLKAALKTPLSFMYEYERTFEKKNVPHFELGTYAHMAFLEPERFEKVAPAPSVNLSTKEGMLTMIDFYRTLEGKRKYTFNGKMQDLKKRLEKYKARCTHQVIDPEHFEIIRALKNNYYWYGGGIIPMLLKGATAETSFYGKDPETGLELKVRPDFFNISENIGVNAVISFKTTRADSIGKFSYDCAKHMYELTEGMYQEVMSNVTGRKFNVTIMIMLQTIPPYQPAVLFWSPEDIQLGKYKYHQALSIVRECFEKKSFQIGFDAKAPKGQCGIIDFELPDWAKKEIHPTAIDGDYEEDNN